MPILNIDIPQADYNRYIAGLTYALNRPDNQPVDQAELVAYILTDLQQLTRGAEKRKAAEQADNPPEFEDKPTPPSTGPQAAPEAPQNP